MAYEVKSSRVASFKIDLVNSENPSDTTSKTINFDVPDSVDITQAETVASTYFAVAGMSNVFQPAGWRDYEGNFEVYLMTGVTPSVTEKTVTTGDTYTPANP